MNKAILVFIIIIGLMVSGAYAISLTPDVKEYEKYQRHIEYIYKSHKTHQQGTLIYFEGYVIKVENKLPETIPGLIKGNHYIFHTQYDIRRYTTTGEIAASRLANLELYKIEAFPSGEIIWEMN